jgi:hypothetical protein
MATMAKTPAQRTWRLPAAVRGWDGAILAFLAVWSLLFTAASLWPWLQHGGLWSGDSRAYQDLWQYMSWIRESGEHGLIANRFDIGPYDSVFLQPMALVSALVWKLGAPIQVAYIAWKPVAIVAIFLSVSAYCRRHLETPWTRRAAIVLALFMFTPAQALVESLGLAGQRGNYSIDLIQSNLLLGEQTAGSLPLVLSVAAMPIFLLGCERLVRRQAPASGRLVLGTAAAGAAAAWLHPWQGFTLLLIVGAAAVWDRLDRSWVRAALPVAATAAPLAYYAVLRWKAPAFVIADKLTITGFAAWVLPVALAFVVLPALPGLRRPSHRDLGDRMLMLWPAVAIVLFFLLGPDKDRAFHAFNGISVPLGVLSVRGFVMHRDRLRRAAVPLAVAGLALLLGSVPVYTVRRIDNARNNAFLNDQIPEMDRALEYLRHVPRPGGVLAPVPFSAPVPAMTGRPVWVGHQAWSPQWYEREKFAEGLDNGLLSPADSRRLVAISRARFVITWYEDLRPLLGRSIRSVRRFGRVYVYEIR